MPIGTDSSQVSTVLLKLHKQMIDKPSLGAIGNLNKSADLGTLPAIRKGQIGALKEEIKNMNLNVTQEDV